MTKVKIDASGHLGEFHREYFIETGKEFSTSAQIFRDFFNFVRKGWTEKWAKLFDALAELEKIEKHGSKRSPG